MTSFLSLRDNGDGQTAMWWPAMAKLQTHPTFCKEITISQFLLNKI